MLTLPVLLRKLYLGELILEKKRVLKNRRKEGAMETKTKNGFTLVEILIVVVILGIIAAIVIPNISEASEQTKTSVLRSTLQTTQKQILLYRNQSSIDIDCSSRTNFEGIMISEYLMMMPRNPFIDDADTARTIRQAAAHDGVYDTGWFYDTVTHILHPNDNAEHYTGQGQ